MIGYATNRKNSFYVGDIREKNILWRGIRIFSGYRSSRAFVADDKGLPRGGGFMLDVHPPARLFKALTFAVNVVAESRLMMGCQASELSPPLVNVCCIRFGVV